MPSQKPDPLAEPPTAGLTPAQRSLRSRMAAYELHSRVDGKMHTAPARAAFLERFENQVDPDRRLSDEERRHRADLALRAHMSRLALKSSKARQAKGRTSDRSARSTSGLS